MKRLQRANANRLGRLKRRAHDLAHSKITHPLRRLALGGAHGGGEFKISHSRAHQNGISSSRSARLPPGCVAAAGAWREAP